MLTSSQVKARSLELGFDACGVAPAVDLPALSRLPDWLARGFGGRMTYLSRTARVRADVRHWLPSARSVIVVASLYNTDEPHDIEIADPARARIARYAWGDDYHDVMGRRLADLAAWMREEAGPGFDARWCVDDGPVQEKVYACHAGIGWIGKNTCVISPEVGSWILLGVLACSLPLDPDSPAVDRCGHCRLCVEACPAGAIVEPYLLDASRCLSYLTIEIRGSIPEEQRPGLGAHVFGCDICQDVCPYNSTARISSDVHWRPRPMLKRASLEALWMAGDSELDEGIAGTALRRAGVRGLRRNLAVAIGNAGSSLASILASEAGEGRAAERRSLGDPAVAEHVAWARTRPRGAG